LSKYSTEKRPSDKFDYLRQARNKQFSINGCNTGQLETRGTMIYINVHHKVDIGKKESQNLWPRVAWGPSLRWLGQKLQIYDATTAMPNGCTYAVCASVTSTNDHNFLALGRNVVTILEIAIKQAFSVCVKKLHSKMDS
jgi:hypothetical protein